MTTLLASLGGRKFCRCCQTTKDTAEFHQNRTAGDGLQSYCKPCMKTYDKPRGASHRRPSGIRATRTPTTRDLCWAAGFLEGEGWFGLTGHESVTIIANQVEWEPIVRLIEMFGGGVNSSHPNHAHTPMLRWRVQGDRARGVMMTLYQFMSTKRRNAIRKALEQSVGNRLERLKEGWVTFA